MKHAWFGLVLLAAGCTPAVAAQARDTGECASDADCVVVERRCCAGCCECPTVMSVRQRALEERRCEARSCAVPDCSHVRCEPCGIIRRAACVRGACVAR
jgi:hypothetical protein